MGYYALNFNRIVLYGLFFWNNGIHALTENQVQYVAQKLGVSCEDIIHYVSCWKRLKTEQALIDTYHKNKVKQLLRNEKNKVVSVRDALILFPEITYTKIEDRTFFCYKPFPLLFFHKEDLFQGFFEEKFYTDHSWWYWICWWRSLFN